MKKIILLFILTGMLIPVSFSQVIDTLPSNKEDFVVALKQKFDATNRSDLKDLYKEFDSQLKQNLIPDNVISNLAEASNRMLQLRGKAYPQLQQLLRYYMKLNEIPLSTSEWNQFQQTLMKLMNNAKAGDSKVVLDFIDFAIPLFRENALWFSKGKIWSLSNDNFILSYEENGPLVSVSSGDIKGKTTGDSLLILNTSGTYDYLTHKWKGSKGLVNWERAGLVDNEVNAVFGAYEIDMKTQGYSVEEVTFTFKDYFASSISGKLEDKMVASATAITTRYPRFSADRENLPAQEITENVLYYGGFTLAGSKILGSSNGEPSELIIFKPNSKQQILHAFTNSITINMPEKISSTNAEVSLYFDEDSIYHPSIDLFYNISENSLKLVKGDGSLAQSSFLNSYHRMDFEVDVITWKLDEDEIHLSTISSSGLKSARFESKEYFSEQKMKALRGNVSYDPLSILRKYTEQNMQNYIYAYEFAKLISPKLSIQQIKPILFNLVREGFIAFDEETEKIKVKPKVNHYVLANAKKKDFDNITIISNDKRQNASINLTTNSLKLEGVKSVPISIANSTLFFPDSQKIIIEKNRDMLFDGLFFSGRFDFFGKGNHFNYDEFSMNLPQIDTLIINVPDGDKVDQYGLPRLRPINSTLENLTGTLNINLPINKSGSSELAQFPIFESTSFAKVYYDDKKIRGGTYKRDKFYYEIEPFTIDSLMHIDHRTLVFNGKLFSSGIFPELNEPLRLQSDLSLGFQVTSPPDGFEVYQGKGKFISDIELNQKGLSGSGIIKYKTTSFESKNILFFPDSMLAVTDTFGVEESKGNYESPWVKSANNRVEWYPYQDSMVAYSDKTNPFEMFDERIKLDGQLEITNNGIHGAGVTDWDDAQLTSKRFKFKSEELLADTAELKIKTLDGDKVTFNTPNVNAYVDFTENTGYFKSNTNENRTEFNYNQYATTIDEFFWDIDNKKLEFSVPEGSTGAPFVSLNLNQDSLAFIATKADYSLEKSIIEASGVSEIFIADSRVIPHEGKVSIYPEARMETLYKATIEANTESKRHIMEDVTITINGKYDIKASGKYKYEAKNTPVQYINLPKIEVVLSDSTQMDKKKGAKPTKVLHAVGLIAQGDNFMVYPDVHYYGDMDIYSSLNDVKIKGYAKVDFKNEYVVSDFLQVEGKVDPDSLDLTLDGVKDPQGKEIRTGIFVNKVSTKPIYTNILNNQIGPLDVPLLEVAGILKHDAQKGIYTFGDATKMSSQDVVKGNIIKFSPSNNEIEGEGSLDLALAFGALEEKVAGQVRTNLSKEEHNFNVSISLPLGFDPSVLDKIGYYLFEDNFDNKDVDYYDENVLAQWAEFLEPKSFARMQEETDLTGTFEKPKDLNTSLMFTDVNLKYYPAERLYRSEGKIGLSFVGGKSVHKMINGYLEFGHRMGSDYMNVYLKTSYNDFVYITYTTTLMEVASSFTDIVGAVNAIDPSKRKIRAANGSFYLYTGINEMKARAFVQRMKILEKGGTLPPPEPPRIRAAEPVEEIKNDAPSSPVNTGAPQEVLDFENNKSKGKDKNKNSTSEDVIEKTPSQPENSGAPQEVLDFEDTKSKGKDKSKKDGTEEVVEEEVIDQVQSKPEELEVPEKPLDLEDNKGKGKSKNADTEEVLEEEIIEDAPSQIEEINVPQEVLNLEDSKGKGKKNKND